MARAVPGDAELVRRVACPLQFRDSRESEPIKEYSMITVSVGLAALWLLVSVKVLSEYEWGVLFRFGKLLSDPRGSGIVFVAWPVERMIRVSLRSIELSLPSLDTDAGGDGLVKVDAVVHFRVTDPVKAVARAEGDLAAPGLAGQATLPSSLGQGHMDGLVSERERLGALLQEVIDQHGDRPTGKVSDVAVKAVVDLPAAMRGQMARLAASERAGPPLQLRSLQTNACCAVDGDAKIAFPIPSHWMSALLQARETSMFTVPGRRTGT